MPDVQVPTREKLGQHASYMQEHPLQKRRQMTIKKTKKSHTNAQRSKSAETSRDQESRPFAIAEGSAKRMIIQPCQGRKISKLHPRTTRPVGKDIG